MEKTVGIIGGMGPLASAFFYNMVTEHTKADKDQEHAKLLILSDTSIPDRTEVIKSGRYDALCEKLLADCRLLENAGCGAVCVTCNTAHFFMNRIKDKLNVPFIHMINETAKSLEAFRGELIGVMAADGTVQTELYQNALSENGLNPFVPDENIQKKVMYQIYERIKSGKRYDAQLWQQTEDAYRAAGCKKVILACTELSVIKQQEKLSDYYTDAMEILAKKVIEFAGKEYV